MERKPTKVSIIGAGAVGSACAFSIATQRLAAEIAIIDVNKDKAEGEAMDISHGLITMGSMDIHSGDYADIADSDLTIVTAGVGRKPGETRLDLAAKNIAIARDVVAGIKKNWKDGAVMVVSNPVDVITYVIQKESGLPAGRVFGTPLSFEHPHECRHPQHPRLYGGGARREPVRRLELGARFGHGARIFLPKAGDRAR